jgi:hypothetical protein
LLALAAELRRSTDPRAQAWAASLAPLEREAATRIESWLPKLHYAIRIGEHNQTAFSFGLIWDWATIAGDKDMQALLASRGRDYYLDDRRCPLEYEPSGEDFLSPCLAEADFMRRLLGPADYAKWLSGFLPQIPERAGRGLARARCRDRSQRSEARAHRRPEPEPGLDARRHRRGACPHTIDGAPR